MKKIRNYTLLTLFCFVLFNCSNDEDNDFTNSEIPNETIYSLPVVVHVVHTGQEIGVGYNLSEERIIEQIQILNNDFRKKVGTLGYNTHPLGADSKIEFKFAEVDPNGNTTNGITRVNANDVEYESDKDSWFFDNLPHYNYWNVKDYINIWVFPFKPNIILGQSSVPQVNLPGLEHASVEGASGIMITTPHFGKTDLEGGANLGRSLTHEMGHFLGLEHLWGKTENADCMEFDDYCDDTPPVSRRTGNCDSAPPMSCNGEPALIHNYMDYTSDACMNMFTKDQVARMRYVLVHSGVRKSLTTSLTISRD